MDHEGCSRAPWRSPSAIPACPAGCATWLAEGRPELALELLAGLPREVLEGLFGEVVLLEAEAHALRGQLDQARALLPSIRGVRQVPGGPSPEDIARVLAMLEP